MNPAVAPDTNFESIYGQKAHAFDALDLTKIDGNLYSSILKISHSSQINGVGLRIAQGLENSVDIDFCDDVHLSGDFGLGPVNGDQVITIKGGTKNYSIAGMLHSDGKRGYEVAVGNWFDQAYGLCGKGTIDVVVVNGHKARVAIGWAVPFSTHLGKNCQYVLWGSIKLKAYVITKFVIRFFLGIKKGTKGPSWF